MENIGFIGLGVMGLPMSKRLKQAGYELYVYDIDPKPIAALEGMGAHKCQTPKDVSSSANIVITMLPTPVITRQTILGENGAIHGFRPGSIYVDMSTSSPTLTREICGILAREHVEMLDAPVSGGIKGATEGTLTIMVGGNSLVFEKVNSILSCIGNKLIHVGDIGAGHTVKIINNMLFAVNMAATAEALVLGKKAGVDPVMLREVMNTSSGGSYALNIKVRDFIFPRNFEPGFAVDLENKDLALALDLAKDVGMPMLLGSFVKQMYQALAVQGYGKKDTSSIVIFFEELAGSGEIKAKTSI